MDAKEFFTDYGEATRYTIREVIGKGSYGVVCSAVDNYTGEKVRLWFGRRRGAAAIWLRRSGLRVSQIGRDRAGIPGILGGGVKQIQI
jgi:serine/threonine protein kinase